MAGWNGSDRKGAAPVQPKVTAKKPSPVRGLIAGGVVVVLAVVAYFVFFSGAEKPQKEATTKERSRIKEVTPAAAPKFAEEVEEKKPKVEIKNVEGGRIMKYVDGKPAWLYPRIPISAHPITNHIGEASWESKVLECRSDVEIAFLLNREPGTQVLGFTDYGISFESDFKESLKKPIVINPDDTPEAKALKEAVIEARKELVSRMNAGENLADVMAETEKSLQELGMYREEIKKMVEEKGEDGDLSASDIKDLLGAANMMLEERGAKPMEMPAFLEYKLQQMGKGDPENNGENEVEE